MESRLIHWFRAAAPYINAHRGHVFVVQFSGDLVSHPAFTGFVHDLVLLDALGIRLVLVHDARAQIDASIAGDGDAPRFAAGRRTTDEAAMRHVKQAVGLTRLDIEARLSMGLANSPMDGARIRVVSGNYVTARPVGVRDGVDHGYTGEVRRIDGQALAASTAGDQIVLLSPIGYSPTGELFHLDAEEVATAAATAIGAAKLVLVTVEDDTLRALPRELTVLEATTAVATRRDVDEAGTGDLTRRLGAAVRACRNGVRRAHLVDAGVDGALLLEFFTRDGIGVMVNSDSYDQTRRAGIDDVAGILELIAPLERDGVLVRRSRERLETEIEQFTVMERDGTVVACAALYPYRDTDTAELACLAVHSLYRSGERGDTLLAVVEGQARASGAATLFVLTTHTAHWFMERGFERSSVDALPVARQRMYNYQRNAKVLVKRLR